MCSECVAAGVGGWGVGRAVPEADRLVRLGLSIEPLYLHPLSLLLCSPLSIWGQGVW